MSDNPTDHEATATGWERHFLELAAQRDQPARIAELEQCVAELEQVIHNLTGIPASGFRGGAIGRPLTSEQR